MRRAEIEVDFTSQIIALKEKEAKQAIADSDNDDDSSNPDKDQDDASKNGYLSDMKSPTFLVGDKVQNVNKSCSCYGSQGCVTKVSKADDDGGDDTTADDDSDDDSSNASKTEVKADDDGDDDTSTASMITYSCTNSGPNWKQGDTLVRAHTF